MSPFLVSSEGGDHDMLREVLVAEIRVILSGGPVGSVREGGGRREGRGGRGGKEEGGGRRGVRGRRD